MNTTIRAFGALTAGAVLASVASALPANADDVSIAPIRTIGGPSNALLGSPLGLHMSSNGRTYVTNYAKNSIAVFASGANGDVPPEREIAGPATTLSGPRYLDVDSAGYVWVANGTSATAFAPSASGNAAPAASFATGMTTFGLTVSASNKVFVGNGSVIKRFPQSASGPASAERTLTNPALANVRGLDADTSGRLWVANGAGKNVLAFDQNADGGASPLRSIKGPLTGIQYASDVATDSVGRIYVVDENAKTVRIFAPNANGDVAPVKVLGGPAAQLSLPAGIAIGPKDTLTVANYGTNTVSTFASLFASPVTVTVASAPRTLKVKGAKAAKTRTITWKAPSSTGGAPVTRYFLVIKKGSKVMRSASLGPSKRSYKVKRSALRNGKLVVSVQAKNSKGWGKAATKGFTVRK